MQSAVVVVDENVLVPYTIAFTWLHLESDLRKNSFSLLLHLFHLEQIQCNTAESDIEGEMTHEFENMKVKITLLST